jgi:hypothetical protein
MLFREVVFWVILPCKMIVDRRFRGAYCLHHQGWVSLAQKDRGYICVQCRGGQSWWETIGWEPANGSGHLYKPRSFRARLTHPWWWRQKTPYSPPWELEISRK